MRTYKRNVRFILVMAMVSLGVVRANAGKQDALPLALEDGLKTHSFGNSLVALSPDAKWLAYALQDDQKVKSSGRESYARTGIPYRVQRSAIWIVSIETGDARNLTGATSDNWLPVWSPDSHFLAFLSDRDGSGQARLWVWDAIKNDLRRVSDIDVRADEIRWTSDSRMVLITTLPQDLPIEAYVRKVFSPSRVEKSMASQVPGSTAILYEAGSIAGVPENAWGDLWNLDAPYLRDLAFLDVLSGKASVIVHGHRVSWYSLSPEGVRIAYASPKGFDKRGQQLSDLTIVTLSTKREQPVASDILLEHGASWSPDGSKLGYLAYAEDEKAYNCYVANVTNGDARNVSHLPIHPYDFISRRPPLWGAKGEYIYFIEDGVLWRSSVYQSKGLEVGRIPNRKIAYALSEGDNILWTHDEGKSTVVITQDDLGKQDGFYKVDLRNGESTKLLEKGQSYTSVNPFRPAVITPHVQYIAYFVEDAEHPPDLWMSDFSFRSSRRLTHINPQFDKYKLGTARLVDWLSGDGERLYGALLLPPDYQEGKRYPLLVWVYRGASLSNQLNSFGLGHSGPFNMQFFATRGYAVLFPDAVEHRQGTAMLDLAESVLPGVNKIIEMGIAEPKRLGVMGHSGGGYSALALIVQTQRFKAAIEVSGWADFMGLYGVMLPDGTGHEHAVGEEELGGSPWQHRERYIENSPIFYLDKVETPLLIIHGSNDSGPASFLADETFVAMRQLGKQVKYAKYEGEDHSPNDWRYANQVDLCNRMVEWFGEYLKEKRSD